LALNVSSRGAFDRTSSVRSTCSASAGGSPCSSFSKAEARSGFVLVRIATISRADRTTAIASDWVSFSGGRKAFSWSIPQRPPSAPDRDADLLVDRLEIR
jgi:hypothetical protein